VLGVVPYVVNHGLPEEDAVAIEAQNREHSARNGVDIAVIALPHIANFDDFDPLKAEAGVSLRYVSHPNELGRPHAVIIPGTKSTIADLNWLHVSGLARRILNLAADSTAVVGICGGYQMLGVRVCDPTHVESDQDEILGLGLLASETRFLAHKMTEQVQAKVTSKAGWLGEVHGQTISGYEIHMGQTNGAAPWLALKRPSTPNDGDMSADGRIWGCYLHGLFANDNLRRAWLRSLGWQDAGLAPPSLEAAFDRLADVVEAHLRMALLEEIIGL